MGDATDLRAVAKELQTWNPKAAERVRRVADAVEEPKGNENWAGFDARDAVDLPTIVSSLHDTHSRPHLVSQLERIRNMLVLVPILITWAGLWQAMTAYGRAVQGDPLLAERPFLLLWEQGFAGQLPQYFTLSAVAAADVAVILGIAVLTFFVHSQTSVWMAARTERIAALEGRLQASLLDATLELRSRSSLDRAVDRFGRSSKKLLDEMTAERAHLEGLANARELNMAEIEAFVTQFQAAATDLAAVTQPLARTVAASATASEKVRQAVSNLSSQVARLEATLLSASRESTAGATALASTASAVELTAASLTQASEALGPGAARMSDSAEILRREVAELRRDLQTDREAYSAAAAATSEAAKQIATGGLMVRAGADELVTATQSLASLSGRLVALMSRLER